MSEPATVAQEKLCPKCGASLGEKAIACPKCGTQIAKAQPDKIELTTGQKIAAVVLIVNGLAMVAETVLTKDSQAAHSVRSAIVSIALGGYLFTGRASALKWAKIAAILGGVLFTVLQVVQGDYFSAGLQLVFSLSLVGLLFGQAGKVRLALCGLVALGYFVLAGVGLYMEATKTPEPPAQSAPTPKT